MKTVFVLVLALAFFGKSDAQILSKVIRIEHFARGGNYSVTIFIGSDSTSINEVERNYPRNVPPSPFFEIYCVNPKTVEYISKYISNYCDSVDRQTAFTESGFYIDVINKRSQSQCYLMDRKSSKPYFLRLQTWIEKSLYYTDSKKIIERIKPWTR